MIILSFVIYTISGNVQVFDSKSKNKKKEVSKRFPKFIKDKPDRAI